MASAAKKQHRIKEPVKSAARSRRPASSRPSSSSRWSRRSRIRSREWSVEEARDHKPDAQVGEEIHLPISTEGLGRIAAQSAKQVLYQRIREAEREKI